MGLVAKPTGNSRAQPSVLPTTRYNNDGPSTSVPPRKQQQRTKSSIKRPALHRAPTTQTAYIDLLIRLDEIPRWHNMLAAFCTWILLAGYLVFPATFTSLQSSAEETSSAENNDGDVVKTVLASTVKNVGLLWLAGICCVIGAAGILWLWVRWWWHYIWLLNKVFLPGATSSFAGLISTLVNIYSAQHGHLNVTAKVTLAVTAGCSGAFTVIFLFHQLWLLRRVKKAHERVVEADERREREKMGEAGESKGRMERMKEKAQGPASMAGGVV